LLKVSGNIWQYYIWYIVYICHHISIWLCMNARAL
jgi:beta-lactamase regulating signal transducer with metallopeptidase domain